MKKVYLVPARGTHPNDLWYPWVKSTLEQAGYVMNVPHMPNPDNPQKQPGSRHWNQVSLKLMKTPTLSDTVSAARRSSVFWTDSLLETDAVVWC